MVPPAALCIHLCIGQAYAFSVFNLPMTKLLGISKSAPGDWSIPELGWIFSVAIFVLGFSAAIFGRWVEEGGPRRAMFTAALCWAVGFFISAIGVYVHNIWVVYFGYGLVGGCGLGLGYISPVSTLIKWFPDRPGMATGMAIMGFGGGAFIASPLSVWLMNRFSTADARRRCRDIHRPGRPLFHIHDGGRVYCAAAGSGLETGRLRGAGSSLEADHHQRRLCLRRTENSTVLVHLDRALHQRHRRHRRHRPGVGNEPGDVPRPHHRDRSGRLRRA